MNFVDDAAPPLQLDTLAQAELSTNVEIGTTTVPVVSVDGFLVGGVTSMLLRIDADDDE